MKRILLSLSILAIAGLGNSSEAQCDLQFSNLQIQIVGAPIVLGPNRCQVTFNAQFDISVNSGFKVLYFHSWLTSDYPSPSIFDCSNSNAQDPGTSVQLGTAVDDIGKSFLDIGFTNVPTTGAINVVQPLAFSTTYAHDNTVVLTMPSNSPGLTASKFFNGTADHYTVNNIKVIINAACGGPVGVRTDIWGSNSNAPDPKAQCYICGIGQFYNDPTITGFRNCNEPRQYTVGISTVDPTVKNITYKVYIDMNDNGNLDGGDVLAYTSGTIQISAPGGPTPDNYSSGLISLPSPYSDTHPYSEKGYIILVEGPTLTNSVVKDFPNPGCIPLPVEFKSFTAARNQSNVSLTWITAFEQNSSGFEVQRQLGTANWEVVAFIPTQAVGGNSNADLTYFYNDRNPVNGITNYRIRQVDLDAKSKYSIIKSVRGEGQIGKTIVFPNPSHDGRINVVFEDGNITRNISVMDMYGRQVKQIKGVTDNNIQIDNLAPGVYSIRIFAIETGDQSVEKFIIDKR